MILGVIDFLLLNSKESYSVSVLFSIIIPVFNSQDSIDACLVSIKLQTYKNYEVLLIDGASKDNTLAIVNSYKGDFNYKLKVVSEKDSGVYDAMNKGIKIAKGEWLYFLGSDDYLWSNEILSQVSGHIHSNEGINYIYGNVTSSYLGKKYDGEFDKIKITRKNICHQAIFYKKEVFGILGSYNLKYKINSDWEFNIRCFFHPRIKEKYVDLTIAYFSGGGLSNRVEDPMFSEDRSAIIAHNGYHSLSLNQLKSFCKSNIEFGQLLLKRLFYSISNRNF